MGKPATKGAAKAPVEENIVDIDVASEMRTSFLEYSDR